MKLVLASSNKGKLTEIIRILDRQYLQVVTQSELGIVDAVEDGVSFEENALKKARHASLQSGLPALADDSGLEVDCLNGEPGIHSARFAGENASDDDNIDKLLVRLSGTPDNQRGARFQCVIALVTSPDDQNPIICKGSWEGRILSQRSGENGFGYDPVFLVTDLNCSSASLSPEQKNHYSHRSQALRQLKHYFDAAF